VTLLELFAHAGDFLSHYQDRRAAEQRLRTRGFIASTVAVLLILFFWRRRRPDD
jgi:hypothetical protein